MAAPRIIPDQLTHEKAFALRYDWLVNVAALITRGDRALAQDLVQDAYVQFVCARRDLSLIQNLDGYFHGMLRNLYLSHNRRAARSPLTSLSALEYDSVDIGLRNANSRDQGRLREELWLVCSHACAGKRMSRSHSILILRFFHGYFPSEIAKITRNSTAAISECIRSAREDLQIYVKQSAVQPSVRQRKFRILPGVRFVLDPFEFHRELQQAIFSHSEGACLDAADLENVYAGAIPQPISKECLAHLVSCHRCLDSVNRRLGLPLLTERNAIDMTGRDDEPRGGSDGFASGRDALAPARERVKQVLEHHPRRLLVLVNGRDRASQSLEGERNEISLNLGSDEPVEFVEIISDQGLRLLYLSADDAAEESPDQISQKIALSDGCSVEATLEIQDLRQMLRVVYRDPRPSPARLATCPQATTSAAPTMVENSQNTGDEKASFLKFPIRRRFLRVPWAFGLATGLALFAALLRWPTPTQSAAALLSQAEAAEQAAIAQSALHRTVEVEEFSDGGRTLSRRRMEIWQGKKLRLDARLVYDGNNHRIAGEWTSKDQLVRILSEGNNSVEATGSSPKADFADAWRFDPSAEQFLRWTKSGKTQFEDSNDSCLISYDSQQDPAHAKGLVRAQLRLQRATLRAKEAVLVIRDGEETHQFRYRELSYETKPISEVDPAALLPDLGVTGSAPAPRLDGKQPITTAALEVEALYLLSQANADLGDQVEVKRLPSGGLSIEALVSTRARAREILISLQPILSNPALRTRILSLSDEAVSERNLRVRAPEPMVADSYQFSGRLPALDSEIRQFLQNQGVPASELDTQTQHYVTDILHGSMSLLQRARALRAVATRFRPDELAALDPLSKRRWIAIVERHAKAMHVNAVLLDHRLAPIFYSGLTGRNDPPSFPVTASEVARSSERFFEAWDACDHELSAALSLSLDDERVLTVDWLKIRSLLSEISAASTGIQLVAERLASDSTRN